MISFSASYIRFFCCLACFCCISAGNLFAQNIILPATGKLPDAVQGAVYPAPYTGKPYPLTFTISTGVIPSSWDWIPVGGTPDITTLGIDINPSTGALNYMLAGSPRITSGTAGSLCRGNIEARNNMGILIAQREYSLFVRNSAPVLCTAPKEYVILLDRSGSMSTLVNATDSRWRELVETVSTYLPQLNDALGQTGTLRVYFFNGAGAALKYSGNWGPNWSNRTFIENTLFMEGTPAVPVTPSGGTPLGDAICDAIQGSTATNNRTIILFTDGIQTVPPDYNQVIHEIPCAAGGAVDLDNSPHNQIKFFTIGTGGCDVSLLQELANPDGQFAQASTGGSPELNIFFTSTIPWSLYDCGSPRIVDYRAGSNDTISQKFKINRMIDNLSIRLTTFGRGHDIFVPNLQLFKDGEPVFYNPVETGATTRYFIEFDDPFEAGGEWEVRSSGPVTVPYELAVMVEDKYLKTKLDAGKQGLVYAGDPIDVTVNVSEAGVGVDNAVVRAILLQPGEDLGDLAARTNVSASSLASKVSGDPQGLGQAKIDSLLRTPAFANQVRNDTSGNILTLTPSGNGEYKGTFTGNQLTGTYRVVAWVDGQRAGLGAYEGWETKCVLVDFSRPEDIDLQLTMVDLGAGNGPHRYRIDLQPVNKFGKRFGPAQTRRIGIRLSQGIVGSVKDMLDGSYSTEIQVPEGVDPTITITVIDPTKPVLQAPLSTLLQNNMRAFGVSLHLGVAVPAGAWASAYDPGIALEGDLTYRFNAHWALEAVLGYYAFQPDFSIIGGTAGVVYSRPLVGAYGWHLAAGLGAFQPKNQQTDFGFSLRTGIHKQLSAHLQGNFDVGFTGVPGPEYYFGKATVGVKFFF